MNGFQGCLYSNTFQFRNVRICIKKNRGEVNNAINKSGIQNLFGQINLTTNVKQDNIQHFINSNKTNVVQ